MKSFFEPYPWKAYIPRIVLIIGLALPSCQAAGEKKTVSPNAEMPTMTPSVARIHSVSPSPSPDPPPPSITPTMLPPTATVQPSHTALANAVYYPAGRVSVPILMYHNISDRGNNRYITTPEKFRSEMQFLHDQGYHSITISRLAEIIRGGGELPSKPIVLTFDDGYMGVYEKAFPILKEYGFIGVLYVITGTLGSDKSYGYIQKKELAELIDNGWEIGSHSVTHSSLHSSILGIGNEVRKSKADLEKSLGIAIRSFAYPFAVANPSIEDLVKDSGYESAVGINIFVTHSPKSLYFLSRREVPRGISPDEFAALLHPGQFEIAAFPFATPTPTTLP